MGLVRTTLREFDRLLTRHYNRPERGWESDRKVVLGYLATFESVKDKDIDFIRRITRVAGHIMEDDDSSHLIAGYLKRLYNYNVEGIGIIDENADCREVSSSQRHSFQTQLSYQAGEVAMDLFKKDETFFWSRRAYDCFIFSSDPDKTYNPWYAVNSIKRAGDAATACYEADSGEEPEKIGWLKKAYGHYMKSAGLLDSLVKERLSDGGSSPHDIERSASHCGFAGDSAGEIYHVTGDYKWAARAFNAFITSSNKHKDESEKYNVLLSAGEIAYQVSDLLDEEISGIDPGKDTAWWAEQAKTCYVAYLIAIQESPDHNAEEDVSDIMSKLQVLDETFP